MQQIIDLYKNSENLHHAYFFVTHKAQEMVSDLKSFLEEHLGLKTSGNPDVQHLEFKTLTIEHARDLAFAQERKDFAGSRKVFIIQADFITEEAQNSLLKVFEEPTPGTHFFIISPQDILLPTLRSRMQIIVEQTQLEKSQSILNLKIGERLIRVKEITDAISDEEKTKQDAIGLLNQVERELYEKGANKNVKALEVCQLARVSLYDRGAPVKMILENVMLSV